IEVDPSGSIVATTMPTAFLWSTRCLIAAAISRVRAPSAAMTAVAARVPANALMPHFMGVTLPQVGGGPHVIRNPGRLDYYVDSVYTVVSMAGPTHLADVHVI